MLGAAEEMKLDRIYYLDMTDVRDAFQYENNQLIRSAEGTEAYFTMLEKLDAYLKPYVIYDENGIGHDTQEKRIPIPFLLAVREGEVVSARPGTYELEENQSKYDKLTQVQYIELHELFCSMFKSLY